MKFNINLEDIKYLKILYKNQEDNPCAIKAAIRSFNDKAIVACIKYENDLSVQVPQDVTLSFVCSDGLYRTKTQLKSIENAEPYIFLTLNPPQGLEYQQNREYFRVPVEYNAIYSIQKDNDVENYSCKTIDISANGVSIILPELIVTEQESYLEILIEGIEIRTKVKYIRSEKLEDGYKISFAYSQITNQDRDFISRVCIQKQLEHRRSSVR